MSRRATAVPAAIVMELNGLGFCAAKGCKRRGEWLCVLAATSRCGRGLPACTEHAQRWAERQGIEFPLSQEGEIGAEG